MKVENIVRKLACSPHEFIEIYQEGKSLVDGHTDINKQLEGWKQGDSDKVIRFISDAYAPEQLLKIMGRNAHLKEQQELTISDGGIKIHTFYLPDLVPDSFRVETFWNITKESFQSTEEGDTNSSIVNISIHSESGSYSMGKLLETFVARSIAATIIQYLDIVDSYFSKWRTKMKQLLDPRNFIPSHSIFRFGREPESDEKIENIESDEEQAEKIQTIIKELKQTKNQLFRESQRILTMEIEFSEKIHIPSGPTHHPGTPPSSRTLNQVLWKTKSANTSHESLPTTPPDHLSSSSPFSFNPLTSASFDERLLQSCEATLRTLQVQRRVAEAHVERTMEEWERRFASKCASTQAQESAGALAQMYQCAKYMLPLSLLVIAVLHRRKML